MDTFTCKTTKVANVYKTAASTIPVSGKSIPKGVTFTSTAHINSATNMYRIGTSSNSVANNLSGYWVSSSALSVTSGVMGVPYSNGSAGTSINIEQTAPVVVTPPPSNGGTGTTSAKTITSAFTDITSAAVLNNPAAILSNRTYTRSDLVKSPMSPTGYFYRGTQTPVTTTDLYRLLTDIEFNNLPQSVKQRFANDRAALTSAATNTNGVKASTADADAAAAAEAVALSNPYSVDSEALYKMYGYLYSYDNSSAQLMSIPIGRMNFVEGMPFQYTSVTDRRTGANGVVPDSDNYAVTSNFYKSGDRDMYGRIFLKEIVSNTPIVTFVAGKPKFLTSMKLGIFASADQNKQSKDKWMPLFLDKSDEMNADLEALMKAGGDYDYFSLELDNGGYYNDVNGLCQIMARNMNLTSRKFRDTTCSTFDWGKYNSSAQQDYNIFEEVLGLDSGVAFAFDPQSSISDTISNSTGDSTLAGMLNQASSKVREIEFLAGAGAATQITNLDYNAGDTASAMSGYTSGGGAVMDRIKNLANNTTKGLNVRFPEVWQDSSNSKSYSIDMKFVTPYATQFCKWRYVLVPFNHAFALCAPRSDYASNAYTSPYIIRGFSKGYFNIEMGIVDSFTFKRFGDGDMISADGVPTEIDVEMSLKDLYHTLSMSSYKLHNLALFFNNTGLVDMLGTLSGVNMNRSTLAERISMYAYAATTSVFSNLGGNVMRHIQDRARNFAEKYMYGM